MTTETATRWNVARAHRRLAARIADAQRRLSDHVHAGGDAFARDHGWEIATTTGRFGFGARIYRDPRFGQRATAARRSEPPSGPRPGPSR